MLGNLFLPYHTNRYNRRNVRRFSRTFEEATAIGVICSYKSLIEENGAIDEYIKKLRKNGKKVMPLVFHENSSKTEGISRNSFSKNDLNFFGIWKKDRVTTFVNKEFDFLIYLDLDYNLFVGNVIAKSKAHCRIGIYDENVKPFLEMMIKPEFKSLESLISGVNTMLERIRNDD